MHQRLLNGLTYAAKEISAHYEDKEWWEDRINHRINQQIQPRLQPKTRGIDVPSMDWDVLIVLDGCRFDLFTETVDTSQFDSYSKATSRGSSTVDWLTQNFTDTYGDITYVTANVHVSLTKPYSFHRLTEPWRENFDSETGTILADDVTDAALAAQEQDSDKRLVAHYIQPHYPFVQSPELWFSSSVGYGDYDVPGDDRANDVWQALRRGYVEYDDVWAGYKRNLEYVMAEVWRLIDNLEGKIVVMSDHGNLLGDRQWPIPVRLYGHPPNIRYKGLTSVPWGVIEKGERPEIRSGRVASTTGADDAMVDKQLRSLGYK